MSQFNDTQTKVPAMPAKTQAASGENLPGRNAGHLGNSAARVGPGCRSWKAKLRARPTHLFGGAIAMRPFVRGFYCLFLIAVCGLLVESANASWYWPWSDDQPKQATPLATAPPLNPPKPATAAGTTGGSWIPHPSLPKMPWSSTAKTATPAPNKWAQTQPKPTYPSPWQTVKNGTKHVENATTNAWHKTVSAVTPGSSEPKQAVAQQQPKPSWWSRMWGSSEEEKPEGPRTVGEFMAQKRLEP
jgi:hypothetical protein